MSSTTDIIHYPAQDPFVIIRQCYLSITDGDKNAAAVTIAEIASEDLLGCMSERMLAKVMDKMMELGFISRRHNPAAPYDRTLQYCFELENVQAATDALGQAQQWGRRHE